MDRKKNLETCLVIVTGFVVLFLLKGNHSFLIIAISVGLIGVFLDKPASWITWLWYKIGDVLGKIIPKIILSVVYFLFLFPLSILYRFTGKDRLDIKEKTRKTMWIKRDHRYSQNDLLNPW